MATLCKVAEPPYGRTMSFLSQLFTRKADPREAMRRAYDAIIALGRAPSWYQTGVPDTIDGRFEVITAIISHILIRLEKDDNARQASVYLTELFIDDMDAQLRQNGVGDLMVGKHIGKMMGALGGRLGAYRNAATAADRTATLARNLGIEDAATLEGAGVRMQRLAVTLAATSTADILAGQLPGPD